MAMYFFIAFVDSASPRAFTYRYRYWLLAIRHGVGVGRAWKLRCSRKLVPSGVTNPDVELDFLYAYAWRG